MDHVGPVVVVNHRQLLDGAVAVREAHVEVVAAARCLQERRPARDNDSSERPDLRIGAHNEH